LTIGVPSGVQGVFRNGSRLLVIGLVTSTEVGTFGAAALAIGFQVEALVFMPGLALNVAATSLVGQALGSWQLREARLRGNTAIAVGFVVMVVLATPILLFAEQIIRLFDPSAHPVLLATGMSYIYINTLVLPLSAVAIVANGALRGGGDSMPGLISTIVARTVIAVGSGWLLAFPLGMGSIGVWLGLAIGTVAETVYMGIRWRGSAWEQVALRTTDLYRKHLHALPQTVQSQYLREVRTPLMALPAAREQINGDGVVYVLAHEEVRIHFERNAYRVMAGGSGH
jgi:Na+-driven multidrug efflux pump